MSNTTTQHSGQQPLYKVLNQKRTQGKFYVVENYPSLIICMTPRHEAAGEVPGYALIIAQPTTQEEHQQYNAKYTALAVNNLHILAEALDSLSKWVTMNTGGMPIELIQAKQALSKIS